MVGKNGAQKFEVPSKSFSLTAGSLKRGYLLYDVGGGSKAKTSVY